jgi:hypothetical protein
MKISFTLALPHAAMRPLVVAVLIAALSGCGGGSDNIKPAGDASIENLADDAGTHAPDTRSPDQQGTNTQPVDTTFVDKLFLANSASGFYQFDTTAKWQIASVVETPTNMEAGKWTLETAASIRSYLDRGQNDSLKEDAESVVASYENRTWNTVVLTADSAYQFVGNPFTLVQKGTKVFGKTLTGLELGSTDMSSPLYRVTFEAKDVSDQNLNTVVKIGSESMNNGLPTFLGDDLTQMPQGSESYIPSYESLQSHIDIVRTDLAQIDLVDTRPLEEVQASVGGTIKQFGKYRYLTVGVPSWTCGEPVYVDYNGAIRWACLHPSGEILRDENGPKGYNRIAAEFIANRLKATMSMTRPN